MFNYTALISLVNVAKGDRGLNQFCRDAGLEQSNISRLINGKNSKPPKPAILLAIADNSQFRVTYRELMLACGYLSVEGANNNESNTYHIDITEELLELKGRLDRAIRLTNDNFSKKAYDNLMETLLNATASALILSKVREEIK